MEELSGCISYLVSVKIYSNYFLITTQIFGLRFDVVGIDNELFRRYEKPVSVEAVYEAAIIKRKVSPLANNHAELSA